MLIDLEKDKLQVYQQEQALINTKFEKQKEAIEEICSIIQQLIKAIYLLYTYNYKTLYNILVKLKGVFALKDHIREQECVKEQESLIKLKKGTKLKVQLLKQETIYIKYKGLNLLKTSRRYLIKTFLRAIISISLVFINNQDNKLIDNPFIVYKFSLII